MNDTQNRGWTWRHRSHVAILVLACGMSVIATPPEEGDSPKKTDADLGERLVRKAVTNADEDPMEGMIRLMGEVTRKLDLEFDPGSDTQALQQRIMESLDSAIKKAAARRRPSKPQAPKWRGDRRRKRASKPQREQRKSSSRDGQAKNPSPDAVPAGGDVQEERRVEDRSHDVRRAWGHLPARERDEVLQGIDEEYLDAYRVWIERYYRALQEADE